MTFRLTDYVTQCSQNQFQMGIQIASMYWNILILPDIKNEINANSPYNLAQVLNVTNHQILNNRRQEIQVFITSLDSDPILISYLPENIPGYLNNVLPTISQQTVNSITIKFRSSQCGIINAVAYAVPLSESMSATDTASEKIGQDITFPSSFQVIQGLDVENLKKQSFTKNSVTITPAIQSANIAVLNTDIQTLTITGLLDNLIYNIYVTLQNDYPVYKLKIPDASVIKINTKTLKIRIPLDIFSINCSFQIKIALTLINLFLILQIV